MYECILVYTSEIKFKLNVFKEIVDSTSQSENEKLARNESDATAKAQTWTSGEARTFYETLNCY